MRSTVFGSTDIGRARDHNEDAILALGGEQSPPGVDALLVVADGMGGHAAGEVASGMTIDQISERFGSAEFASVSTDSFEEVLRSLLQDVNRSVQSAGLDDDKRGMGTTCTLAAIRDKRLYYAHVGDSRAYVFRDGELSQLTSDHSWVEEMVRAGSISREAARTHPNRNVITRAIGLDVDVVVDTGSFELEDDDLVVLCSDGLNSMLSDEGIQGVIQLSSHDTVCVDLIESANNAGGHDNTSVTVAYLGVGAISDSRGAEALNADTLEIKPSRSLVRRLWNRISKSR